MISNSDINSKETSLLMNKLDLTPKLGIAFFVLVGVSAAIWVWSALILA